MSEQQSRFIYAYILHDILLNTSWELSGNTLSALPSNCRNGSMSVFDEDLESKCCPYLALF